VKDLPTLKQGAKGFDVKTVRSCLFARGGLAEASYDGVGLQSWLERTEFDDGLAADVKAFQASRKLAADGVVGPKTWPHLLRVS
jgi:murein L,D-transpeptidase YcbB/YkuD